MDRDRLQRAGLQWGGLALVAQLWVALIFVQACIDVWKQTRPELASFAESANRFSQLKTPSLKYPVAGIYFLLFGAALVSVWAWLLIRGLREAMAPEPNAGDDEP